MTASQERAIARVCAKECMQRELVEALQTALVALEAIAGEMTVGDRFTNAGQALLDALQPCRDALARAKEQAA